MVDNKSQPIGKTILNLAELVKAKLAKINEAQLEAVAKK